ncbi:LCP family protein [Actinomadura sp. K4S16]|uniref:LCP family protein n=1 Tax=Actinomadura sp. K4S16 TaxID=1316147 RepID=UPI0011ED8D2F|nr:LCP family protein [Actinomadura sp. K4S16]
MTVDDLELLRDLGRDLEHEPPPSLARQRNRLLDGTRRRRRGPGRWTLLGVVAAVTAAAILVPVVLLHGRGARPAAPNPPPPAAAKALNVLVIGLDARYRGGPQRSDTLMLVHVPADRKKPQVVSIPRDVLVRIPACGKNPAQRATVNAAFTLGGAACTLKTVESLTGVPVDQTVTVDFAGFKKVVDALGGVEVTLPVAVSDQQSGLNLSRGKHLVKGTQALAYVRTRHGLGDGSDLDRVKRQQQFLASVARKAREMMSRDPLRFARFLAVAAGSVESTPKLDAGTLRSLARGFDKGDGAAFHTIPVRPAPSDPNRLVVDEPAARRVLAPFRTR